MRQTGTEAPTNLRLKGIIVCDGLLRLCRLASDNFGNDLDRFVVYLAVISAGASHFQRDPKLRSRYAGEEPLPDDLRLGISRRAIADSVGLPRETVRRKIAGLIAEGHVVEEGGLVKARGPVVEQGRNQEFLIAALKEFARTADDLRRADKD